MNSEQFNQSGAIKEWLNTIIDSPHWTHLLQEMDARAKYSNGMDQPNDWLEHKAHGYKEGFAAWPRIMAALANSSEEATASVGEYDYSADLDVADVASERFNTRLRSE